MQAFPKLLSEADQKTFSDILSLVSILRASSASDPPNVKDGISILLKVRKEIYEELNQIQHENLAVRSIEWLKNNGYADDKYSWYWNPRQTGDESEPDIRATDGERVLISAEVTASESPKGTIDTRMAKTLKKLSEMQGKKFYFVRTSSMKERAKTKIKKANYSIKVIEI